MSLRVTDLQPGDRVILNCPKSRRNTHREAVFQGTFRTVEEAIGGYDGGCLQVGSATEAFYKSASLGWASFLLQTLGPGEYRASMPGGEPMTLPPHPGVTELLAAFAIDPDGGMREEEGRRVFIERRLRMGQG